MSTTQGVGLGAAVTVGVIPTPASAGDPVGRRSGRPVQRGEGGAGLEAAGGEPQVLLDFRNELLHFPLEDVLPDRVPGAR